MGLLIRALTWAGTVALGWMGSDIMRSYDNTVQAISPADQSKPRWYQAVLANGLRWIVGFVVVFIAVLLFGYLFKRVKK